MTSSIYQQFALFQAENKLSSTRKMREESLDSYRKMYIPSVLVLFACSLIPLFVLPSGNTQVVALVGLATGSLIFAAIAALTLILVFWHKRSAAILLECENDLLVQQLIYVSHYLKDPTLRNVVELGFPKITANEDTILGSTEGISVNNGELVKIRLIHSKDIGYSVEQEK